MTEVRPLSKTPNPQLLPGCRTFGCPLLQVCVHLDGLKAENTFHCWLLCIIVYVTNKAHLSLIIISTYIYWNFQFYSHLCSEGFYTGFVGISFTWFIYYFNWQYFLIYGVIKKIISKIPYVKTYITSIYQQKETSILNLALSNNLIYFIVHKCMHTYTYLIRSFAYFILQFNISENYKTYCA